MHSTNETTETTTRRCDCGRAIRHDYPNVREICVTCVAWAVDNNRRTLGSGAAAFRREQKRREIEGQR